MRGFSDDDDLSTEPGCVPQTAQALRAHPGSWSRGTVSGGGGREGVATMEDSAFASLFERAKGGDPAAREELYGIALVMAHRFARTKLEKRDRALLESLDVQQSILVRLIVKMPRLSFQHEGELAAWLRAVAENLVNEKRRNSTRLKRNASRTISLPIEGVEGREGGSLEKLLARLAVEDLLSGIKPESRDVVRLRALEGRAYAEVAARLGLPSAEAARKRYARALLELCACSAPPLAP